MNLHERPQARQRAYQHLDRAIRVYRTWLGAGLLALLTACGGGGADKKGGGDDPQPGPDDLGTKITLAGIVSKGRLGNANVRVLAIGGDGKVDEDQVLATGAVLDDGTYVTTSFVKPVVYVVESKAKPCADTVTGGGCSFHQDEASGERQYLPTGFRLRAVVTNAPQTDNVARVNLTVLSEMAYGAAAKTNEGLNGFNVRWALSMANGLAGVADLNTVDPVPFDQPGASADQVRVAAFLKAVSFAASSSTALADMGCTTAGGPIPAGTPEATACVVARLSANARRDKYVGDDPRITAALDTQLQAVVAGNANATALLGPTRDKLTDEAGTVPAPETTTQIEAIKALVRDISSTVHTLLDSGATPGSGALQDQARAFEQAVTGAQYQIDNSTRAVSALLMAVSLWHDFEQAPDEAETSELWYEGFNLPEGLQTGTACRLQKAVGAAFEPLASGDGPAAVARVFCYLDADYSVDWSQPSGTFPIVSYPARNPFHWFAVTRTGTPGEYAYSAGAWEDSRRVEIDHAQGRASDVLLATACLQDCAGASSAFTGTLTAGTANGRVVSLRVNGDLPDAFDDDSQLLHRAAGTGNLARSKVDIQAQLENPVYSNEELVSGKLTLGGNIQSFDADGSTEASQVAINTPSFATMANAGITDLSLLIDARTPGARLAGKLTATGSVSQGGSGSFEGALYNRAASESTPFISAKLSTQIDNTHYDPKLPYSASNYQVAKLDFDGHVTAPSHPRIGLTLTAAGTKAEERPSFGTRGSDTLAGNVRLFNAQGQVVRDMTVTLSQAPTTNKPRLTFSDGANGISFWLQDDIAQTDVLVNGAKWGVIDRGDGLMHFVNGDFISLDFGTVSF